MQDLGLDLLPLRPIVQQEQLDLPDEFLLPPIYIILLHLEGALDIAQEQVRVIQLLICLLRARVYHSETDRLLANDWNDRRINTYELTWLSCNSNCCSIFVRVLSTV